jgi:hypothetical protein
VKYYASNSLRLVLAGSVKTTLNGFKLRHKYWKQFKCRGEFGTLESNKVGILIEFRHNYLLVFFNLTLRALGKVFKKSVVEA